MLMTCEQCQKRFHVPPARVKKAKYCSVECHNAGQTGLRRDTVCEQCGDRFIAKPNHGKWPKFCGAACRAASHVKPEEKACAACGAIFLARGKSNCQSEDGRSKYCSEACRATGLRKSSERACANCGIPFYPLNVTQNEDQVCCSTECARAFFVGAASANWRGGISRQGTGEILRRLDRPGYVGRYIGEHRLVASRAIGRLLERYEKVLHINNNASDNEPTNLFICGTNSEMMRRINGSLPWPKRSNLGIYEKSAPETPKGPDHPEGQPGRGDDR